MVTNIRDSYPVEPNEVLRRINSRDVSAWSNDPATMSEIAARLGWMRLPETMRDELPLIDEFSRAIRSSEFTDAVLLGMGGSSLCPLVFSQIFEALPGSPRLHVLDTTNPADVLALESRLDLPKTLFLIASKSGTTVEPLSAFSFFRHRLAQTREETGKNFIAITDPGTPLAEMAASHGFWRVFLNPADVGGRYSALSFFGLVPAAILGIDVRKLLDRASAMAHLCGADNPEANPGWELGNAMAKMWYEGRDKMTFAMEGTIGPFSLWVEQLVAESTGKHGLGIVPVVNEPTQKASTYARDRWFVVSHLDGGGDGDLAEWSRSLARSGLPVVHLPWEDKYSIAAQFYQWEYATALAGSMLGINPFDEPDVTVAKKKTIEILESNANVEMAAPRPLYRSSSLTLSPSEALRPLLGDRSDLPGILRQFMTCAKPGDYYATLAYLPETEAISLQLGELRKLILTFTGMATTCSFGPRYLHSTGQEHKGGADNFVGLMITAPSEQDGSIPRLDDAHADNPGITFGTLNLAQALGDFDALNQRSRRILLARLGSPEALTELIAHLQEVISSAG